MDKENSNNPAENTTRMGSWLKELMRNSIDAIAFVDSEGIIFDVNTSFEKLTGYSKHELGNENTYTNITPE